MSHLLRISNIHSTDLGQRDIIEIFRMAGAVRLTTSAISELNDQIVTYGSKVAKIAVELSNNAGRSTVLEIDIKKGEAFSKNVHG